MRFEDFKSFFQKKLIIDSRDFSFLGNENYLRRQVSEWLKRERLICLKRGIYTINDPLVLEKISGLYVANYIYQPSYISLEYALRFYQTIPEEVYQFTSITTRKTASFQNKLGSFTYRHINKLLFWGFDTIPDNSWNVQMATREKAILDFLYFNRFRFRQIPDLIKSYRFQNLDTLDQKRLSAYLEKIADSYVVELAEKFIHL